MTKLLGEFEERLSNVPRWTIVRTIQKQSVAEHSYRVAIIASRLVPYFFSPNVQGEAYERVVQYALLHDQWEAFTGDIPTPAGRHIHKDAVEALFMDKAEEHPRPNVTVKQVVKVADFVEALIFLAVDMRMGNCSLDAIYEDVIYNLSAYLKQIDKLRLMMVINETVGAFLNQNQDPLSNDNAS